MADANSVRLSFVEEASFGVLPATPEFQQMRITSESLRQETSTVRSAELRSDRQVTDIIRTNFNAAGETPFELSYGFTDYDPTGTVERDMLLKATLLSSTAFLDNITVGTPTLSFDNAAGTILTNSASWAADAFADGDFVLCAGAAVNVLNKRAYRIVSGTAGTTITVEPVPAVTEATVVSRIYAASALSNGTTLNTYSVEKEYTDIATEFVLYNGMAITDMSIEITPEAVITGNFTWIGKKATSAAVTADNAGGPFATQTNPILNAVDNVVDIVENGVVLGSQQASFNIANNIRTRLEIGELGAQSLGKGTVNVTGTLRYIFENKTVFDRYLNSTNTDIWVSTWDVNPNDLTSNMYVFEFPSVRFTEGQRVGGGLDQDVIADMTWEAFREPTLNSTVRIHRFNVA